MNYDLAEIGKRIKACLDKREDVSRDDLGRLLGVGAGAIGRYVRGEADPGSIGIAKIADFFKVSVVWLISGEEDKTSPVEICSEPNAEYGGRKIHLSREEAQIITYLRDMPREYRDQCIEDIHNDWSETKDLL